jgi:trans-aconitate methyltransferase
MIDDERIHLPTSESNHVAHIMAYMQAVPIVKERLVVDLCCGTGYGTRLLSESAHTVIGYDYSEDAINYNNKRKLPNTEFHKCNVEELDDIRADIITCMQGLEHLDDPKALIQRNLHREWIFALPNDQNDSNEYHHHRITPDVIRDWWGDNVLIKYFNGEGQWVRPNEYYTNFWGYYQP